MSLTASFPAEQNLSHRRKSITESLGSFYWKYEIKVGLWHKWVKRKRLWQLKKYFEYIPERFCIAFLLLIICVHLDFLNAKHKTDFLYKFSALMFLCLDVLSLWCVGKMKTKRASVSHSLEILGNS